MNMKQIPITLIYLFSTITLIAQTTEISVDISKLDIGEVPRSSIYILSEGSFKIPQENIFQYKVDDFPTMVKFTVLKKQIPY